jgi:hypothetical protein
MINEFELKNLKFIIIKKELLEKVNAEDFVKNLYWSLGYDVKRVVGILGHPDFIIKQEENEFYVEVKNNNDGLKVEQIEWIKNNPTKNVYCFFFIQKEQNKEFLKKKNKEEKIKEQDEEIIKQGRKFMESL